MPDVEDRIKRTLKLVREAIKALETDPGMVREAIERLENDANRSFELPADRPDVALRKIEHVLVKALEKLDKL